MWRITEQQYQEVKCQEGCSWYNQEIPLGDDNGVPIYTVTYHPVLTNVIRPADAYIKTIALGLRETYDLRDAEIVDYLLEKEGIKGGLQGDELLQIMASPKEQER